MAVEPIYTLKELAKETRRSYWFWDGEIRAGRLKCIRKKPGGSRYVSDSQYDEWFLASLGQPDEKKEEAVMAAAGATTAPDPWVDFEP